MTETGPAHRVQSAVVEYGYPSGHLGHLTMDEETAFKNFKALCIEKGLYRPAEGDKEASHDDATLLRFLRARRFNAMEGVEQFEITEKWRAANQIDTLYETIDTQQYDSTRRLYPQWTGRRDRRGIPVYVFEVKHLDSKTMAIYEKSSASTITEAKGDGSTPPKLLRLFALYENLIRFAMPYCSALPDRDHRRTPITQSNNIVDISGVGLKQFWNLRGHMQSASTLATAHYPETLDRIFIVGAPSFFPTVWSWIKKWFDPITTSKIFILSSSDVKTTLESFMDPENIPIKYGGLLDFEFGYAGPTLDPLLEKYFQWKTEKKEFPIGPLYWRKAKQDGHGVLELIASGSENGGVRRQLVVGVLRTPNTEEDLMNMEPEITEPVVNGDIEVLEKAPIIDVSEPSDSTALPGAKVAVEAGKLVPADRPRLETFSTASDGLPLSPTYSGSIMNVPGTTPEAQEATERSLADEAETPEETASTQTVPFNGVSKKEKTETTSHRTTMNGLEEKLRTSFENLGGLKKKDSLGEGSEKGSMKSLRSQKSLKEKIKDRLVVI